MRCCAVLCCDVHRAQPVSGPHPGQIGITIMHLGRFWTKSEWLTTMLAVQCILLVFR